MKTFIIVVVSLIIGGVIGGFLGLGGGAVGGAVGGLIIGTQTGVCVAADAATLAGLIPADKANELVPKAIERIRSSPKARPVANSPDNGSSKRQDLTLRYVTLRYGPYATRYAVSGAHQDDVKK